LNINCKSSKIRTMKEQDYLIEAITNFLTRVEQTGKKENYKALIEVIRFLLQEEGREMLLDVANSADRLHQALTEEGIDQLRSYTRDLATLTLRSRRKIPPIDSLIDKGTATEIFYKVCRTLAGDDQLDRNSPFVRYEFENGGETTRQKATAFLLIFYGLAISSKIRDLKLFRQEVSLAIYDYLSRSVWTEARPWHTAVTEDRQRICASRSSSR